MKKLKLSEKHREVIRKMFKKCCVDRRKNYTKEHDYNKALNDILNKFL